VEENIYIKKNCWSYNNFSQTSTFTGNLQTVRDKIHLFCLHVP